MAGSARWFTEQAMQQIAARPASPPTTPRCYGWPTTPCRRRPRVLCDFDPICTNPCQVDLVVVVIGRLGGDSRPPLKDQRGASSPRGPDSAGTSARSAAGHSGTAGRSSRSSPTLPRAATTRCSPDPAGLITLTVNELRHLFNLLIIEPTCRYSEPQLWPVRRRLARAVTNHYTRQDLTDS